jgi:hypothetical protein
MKLADSPLLQRGIDPLALKVGDKVRFKHLMVLVAYRPNWIVGTGRVERIKFGYIYFKCRRGRFCVPIDEPAWTEAR